MAGNNPGSNSSTLVNDAETYDTPSSTKNSSDIKILHDNEKQAIIGGPSCSTTIVNDCVTNPPVEYIQANGLVDLNACVNAENADKPCSDITTSNRITTITGVEFDPKYLPKSISSVNMTAINLKDPDGTATIHRSQITDSQFSFTGRDATEVKIYDSSVKNTFFSGTKGSVNNYFTNCNVTGVLLSSPDSSRFNFANSRASNITLNNSDPTQMVSPQLILNAQNSYIEGVNINGGAYLSGVSSVLTDINVQSSGTRPLGWVLIASDISEVKVNVTDGGGWTSQLYAGSRMSNVEVYTSGDGPPGDIGLEVNASSANNLTFSETNKPGSGTGNYHGVGLEVVNGGSISNVDIDATDPVYLDANNGEISAATINTKYVGLAATNGSTISNVAITAQQPGVESSLFDRTFPSTVQNSELNCVTVNGVPINATNWDAIAEKYPKNFEPNSNATFVPCEEANSNKPASALPEINPVEPNALTQDNQDTCPAESNTSAPLSNLVGEVVNATGHAAALIGINEASKLVEKACVATGNESIAVETSAVAYYGLFYAIEAYLTDPISAATSTATLALTQASLKVVDSAVQLTGEQLITAGWKKTGEMLQGSSHQVVQAGTFFGSSITGGLNKALVQTGVGMAMNYGVKTVKGFFSSSTPTTVAKIARDSHMDQKLLRVV